MKELSIEEKAKAYDEAIERAKKHCADYVVETIFPELKESEDDKIRQKLINLVKMSNEVGGFALHKWEADEILAWLEKQGKQPSAIRWYDVSLIPEEMEELLVEWDSEDATWHEIAFYHADTKTFWNGTRQVENVTRWCYIIDLLEKQGGQKSTEWDEYDEMYVNALVAIVRKRGATDERLRDELIGWLSCLKCRLGE